MLGWSDGDGGSAAELLSTTILYGLPSLEILLQDLPHLSNPYAKTLTKTAPTTFDAQGQSALQFGEIILGYSHNLVQENGSAQITVETCRHSWMILPLFASKNATIRGERWGSYHLSDLSYPAVFFESFPYHEPTAITLMLSNERSQRVSFPTTWNIIEPEVLERRIVEQRQNGIFVDEDVFSALTKFSKRVLVEATDESRAKGAGGV